MNTPYFRFWIVMLFLVCGLAAQESAAESPGKKGRILNVDQRGNAEFKSLSAAAKVAGPGDTINIVAGSGPYREVFFIKQSGTAEAPIIVEGNNETVTGFDIIPPESFKKENDLWVCDLPKPPYVLAYKGVRLLQDFKSRQFLQFAKLDEVTNRMELLPETEKEGWEISKRPAAVKINDASYHIYKNIRASGTTNDGFNLHGKGEGIVFLNIEGFHNVDEGFSSHDEMFCEVNGGKFWGNDNGLANGVVCTTKIENVETYSNLGWGLSFHDDVADLKNIKSWGNGVTQIILGPNSKIRCENVIAYLPTWTDRPWVSLTESKGSKFKPQGVLIELDPKNLEGTPQVLPDEKREKSPTEVNP